MCRANIRAALKKLEAEERRDAEDGDESAEGG
jgi:hypothetical protein